jgi:hypothetical protein
MPEITKYDVSVEIDVDVSVEVDEFLNECLPHEIEEILEWLIDTKYIKPTQLIHDEENISLGDLEYLKIMSKLIDPMVRFRLSEEDLCTIQQISDKL